jgi:cysteine synthase A
MPSIASNVTELIGKTPLLRLDRYAKSKNLPVDLIAKVELFNPSGSVKDRAAFGMIRDAERRGLLSPGGTIIEPTSGNTGIGLAAMAAVLGYRVILTMPDTMSAERRKLMAAYGAELVLTEGALGLQGSVDKAREIAASLPNSFVPDQYSNAANTEAHYTSTGPEIWQDSNGMIDIFVSGIGTGGTITGTGRYLKEQNPAIRVVAVEPADSPLLSGGKAAPHGLQGMGANFIPGALDVSVYDQIVSATLPASLQTAQELARTEGIIAGISSGAILWAASQAALEPANHGKMIVAILPDSGDRYFSTGLFTP